MQLQATVVETMAVAKEKMRRTKLEKVNQGYIAYVVKFLEGFLLI
jgi:hypothetical protein